MGLVTKVCCSAPRLGIAFGGITLGLGLLALVGALIGREGFCGALTGAIAFLAIFLTTGFFKLGAFEGFRAIFFGTVFRIFFKRGCFAFAGAFNTVFFVVIVTVFFAITFLSGFAAGWGAFLRALGALFLERVFFLVITRVRLCFLK